MSPMPNEFLPPDYKVPKKPSRYLKLQKGETRLRILSPPLTGFVAWRSVNGKRQPIRREDDSFRPGEYDKKQLPRHFWAMPVWDYASQQVKVWEVTQTTIQTAITKMAKSPKWGPPYTYDVVIGATGDGMEREYSVIPEPKEPLDEVASAAWEAVQKKFDIARLMNGGDPFGEERDGAWDDEAPGADDDIPF